MTNDQIQELKKIIQDFTAELEEYRSIAEKIGAEKAVSDKEKLEKNQNKLFLEKQYSVEEFAFTNVNQAYLYVMDGKWDLLTFRTWHTIHVGLAVKGSTNLVKDQISKLEELNEQRLTLINTCTEKHL